MTWVKKILVFAVLACAVCGCQYLAPIGPIMQLGVYWIDGESHKYYATEQPVIEQAVRNVLEEFKLPILEEKTEDNYLYIKAGDDDRFKIKIHKVRENVTKLSIRINTWGDKPYCEMIYRHVDQQPQVIQFTSLKELNAKMESR